MISTASVTRGGPARAAHLSRASQRRDFSATRPPISQNGNGRISPPTPSRTTATASSGCLRARAHASASGTTAGERRGGGAGSSASVGCPMPGTIDSGLASRAGGTGRGRIQPGGVPPGSRPFSPGSAWSARGTPTAGASGAGTSAGGTPAAGSSGAGTSAGGTGAGSTGMAGPAGGAPAGAASAVASSAAGDPAGVGPSPRSSASRAAVGGVPNAGVPGAGVPGAGVSAGRGIASGEADWRGTAGAGGAAGGADSAGGGSSGPGPARLAWPRAASRGRTRDRTRARLLGRFPQRGRRGGRSAPPGAVQALTFPVGEYFRLTQGEQRVPHAVGVGRREGADLGLDGRAGPADEQQPVTLGQHLRRRDRHAAEVLPDHLLTGWGRSGAAPHASIIPRNPVGEQRTSLCAPRSSVVIGRAVIRRIGTRPAAPPSGSIVYLSPDRCCRVWITAGLLPTRIPKTASHGPHAGAGASNTPGPARPGREQPVTQRCMAFTR